MKTVRIVSALSLLLLAGMPLAFAQRGRDFMGLIEALPGFVDLNLHDARGYNAGMATVAGGQAEKLNVSLDGVPSVDPGNTTHSGTISPSVDAISGVTVLVSNFSAVDRPAGAVLPAERCQLQAAFRDVAGNRQHSAHAFPGTRT